MNDIQYPSKDEMLKNMQKLYDKLSRMIPKPPSASLNKMELEISGLMHEIQFFIAMIDIVYPLERAYDGLVSNPNNENSPQVIEVFVELMDLNLRKAFLLITQFNLETLLSVIVEEHNIDITQEGSLTDKYVKVLTYFDIDHKEYKKLLDIYHRTRNTLHDGGKITREWRIEYGGKIFEIKKGGKICFANWRYFTWFTSEVLTIYEKIINSKKYKMI